MRGIERVFIDREPTSGAVTKIIPEDPQHWPKSGPWHQVRALRGFGLGLNVARTGLRVPDGNFMRPGDTADGCHEYEARAWANDGHVEILGKGGSKFKVTKRAPIPKKPELAGAVAGLNQALKMLAIIAGEAQTEMGRGK